VDWRSWQARGSTGTAGEDVELGGELRTEEDEDEVRGEVLGQLRRVLDVPEEVEGAAVPPVLSGRRGVVGDVAYVKLLGRWSWCSGAGRCREGEKPTWRRRTGTRVWGSSAAAYKVEWELRYGSHRAERRGSCGAVASSCRCPWRRTGGRRKTVGVKGYAGPAGLRVGRPS
jgi:hypothetical protein